MFTTLFEGASADGLNLSFQELQYYRSCSKFMNIRWNYDHEYFQQMIGWEQQVDADIIGVSSLQRINTRSSTEAELVGTLITNMHKLFLED